MVVEVMVVGHVAAAVVVGRRRRCCRRHRRVVQLLLSRLPRIHLLVEKPLLTTPGRPSVSRVLLSLLLTVGGSLTLASSIGAATHLSLGGRGRDAHRFLLLPSAAVLPQLCILVPHTSLLPAPPDSLAVALAATS